MPLLSIRGRKAIHRDAFAVHADLQRVLLPPLHVERVPAREEMNPLVRRAVRNEMMWRRGTAPA